MQDRLRQVTAGFMLGLAVWGSSFALSEEPGRRAKVKVAPVYPELARKLSMSGIVKLEVTIIPNGTVKSTRVIGGNPVLVQAALEAVKNWQFEPAPSETKQIVEFSFVPR